MSKFYSILLLVLFVAACKKNELGGNAVIEGTIKHHNKVITKASAFIKFNAKEFPGSDTNLYDAKVRVDDKGYFKFNVYKGSYYIYAFGYDYAIPSPYHVVGGVPVKNIRAKETIIITVPVTEGD
jgi:hypothetical protein